MKTIVVGAGLGGLAAAIALRRGGHEVIVLEQADRLAEVGAGIQIAPNAARLLQAWGVADVLAGRSVPAEHSNRRRWADGRILGSFPLGDLAVRRYGGPYLCQHRADLHAALLEVATADEPGSPPGPPVQVRLGTAVSGVEADGERPALLLDGGGRCDADVVIGADGVRSIVRELLFGSREVPPGGQITQRMILPVDSLPDDPGLAELLASPDLNIWLGPGRHAVLHPVRGLAGLYLGVTTATASAADAAELARGDHARLLDSLEGWDPCLIKLVAAAPGLTSWPLSDRDVSPRWVSGRVALTGDACHAMLPFQAQGAAQAMEDAAVLGDVLDGVQAAGAPAALARYEALRRPRAERVLQASRSNGDLFHFPDGPEQEARDIQLRERSGDFESYLWLWAAAPDGSKSNAAPDR